MSMTETQGIEPVAADQSQTERSAAAAGDAAANQDFGAAMHEIESNLEVRRLMFVLSNVLVPAMAMAMTDCLTGSDYVPALAWLPTYIIPFVGAVMAVASTLVSCILVRCHFGLVLNGSKMHKVRSGQFTARGLNWLGVTTNFVGLTALSAGAGLSLVLISLGWPMWAMGGGPGLFLLLMLYLRANHWRANRRCRKLESGWSSGQVDPALQERHARLSLDATTSDVSVIVIMAAALFAGAFNAMTNVGGVPSGLQIHPPAEQVKAWGVLAISGFTLLSLMLSGRMVVRLRIALGEHASTLARLRNEEDNPWLFKPRERTYLLFMLLHMLAASTLVILVWSLSSMWPALLAGAGLMLVGLVWYPLRLGMARRAH